MSLVAILSNLFPGAINLIERKAALQREIMLHEEREEDHKKNEIIQLKEFVGKRIISVSDGYADIFIGYGAGINFITQAKNPVLIGVNALTGDEMMLFGKVFLYSKERFDALMSLTPSQRASLIMPTRKEPACDVDETVKLLSKSEILTTLQRNGFFEPAFSGGSD